MNGYFPVTKKIVFPVMARVILSCFLVYSIAFFSAWASMNLALVQ